MSVAEDYSPDDTQEEQTKNPQAILANLMAMTKDPNLADTLEEDVLSRIAHEVSEGVQSDEDSRSDWKRRTEKGMELALQDQAGRKTWPWPGAADVKYPVMTTAAIQFAARAYPAIISGANVVRAAVFGDDPDGLKRQQGDREAEFMSWQLLQEMPEWEPGVDRMLHALPIIGCAFKKTYFDSSLGRNVSTYRSAMDIVVNASAVSLETAPRITDVFELYPHEIKERILSGVFVEFDYGQANNTNDKQAPHTFWEQHCRIDLDEDGYLEPYIVTVHKEKVKVCRIRAGWDEDTIRVQGDRLVGIDRVPIFTKIPFIPHPGGEFYDVGFAYLLAPINESINTILNQLIDAGTLANTGGGFIGTGLRLKGGTLRFRPGEFKQVDVTGEKIADSIYNLQFAGPSPVLFQLLGTMIDGAKDIASVQDVLTGDVRAQTMQPATLLGLVEQGLKVFTAIYKRIHRALESEFDKLYRLNRIYFDPDLYAAIQGAPAVQAGDFQSSNPSIQPISDPTMVSDMQRLARTQFLEAFKADPLMNRKEINRRQLEAAGIENVEELFMPEPQGPGPAELAEFAQLAAETDVKHSQADKNRADAIKSIAQAEAAELGPQVETYKLQLESMKGRQQDGLDETDVVEQA